MAKKSKGIFLIIKHHLSKRKGTNEKEFSAGEGDILGFVRQKKTAEKACEKKEGDESSSNYNDFKTIRSYREIEPYKNR